MMVYMDFRKMLKESSFNFQKFPPFSKNFRVSYYERYVDQIFRTETTGGSEKSRPTFVFFHGISNDKQKNYRKL